MKFFMYFVISSYILLGAINPYKNISQSDKLTALSEYFLKSLANNKAPKAPRLIKDEFESTNEFKARVSSSRIKYNQKIQAYKNARKRNAKRNKNKAIKMSLSVLYGDLKLVGDLRYDADNEYFFTKVKYKNKKKTYKLAIKVPKNQARAFKKSQRKIVLSSEFSTKRNSIALAKINFKVNGRVYPANLSDDDFIASKSEVVLQEYVANRDINSKITIVSNDPQIAKLNKQILQARRNKENINHRKSLEKELALLKKQNVSYDDDILKLLSKSKKARIDKKKWLFVIGIEKYIETDNIAFAKRSASIFAKVMQKKLGIKKSQSFILIDDKATLGAIKNKLNKMIRKVKKGDTVYFYYNGHGIPVVSKDKAPYMLAYDIDPADVAQDKFFSLDNLYKTLERSKAKKTFAFIDSCFSGATDGKSVLKGVAAPRLKAKKVNFNKTKMVVISAGKDKQYSNKYDKRGHRLFSYFLMKEIINGKKNIKSIYKNTYKKVKTVSYEDLGRNQLQEPSVQGNTKLSL